MVTNQVTNWTLSNRQVRLVIPVGVFTQDLVVFEKTESGIRRRSLIPVRFVPMTGKSQKQ